MVTVTTAVGVPGYSTRHCRALSRSDPSVIADGVLSWGGRFLRRSARVGFERSSKGNRGEGYMFWRWPQIARTSLRRCASRWRGVVVTDQRVIGIWLARVWHGIHGAWREDVLEERGG